MKRLEKIFRKVFNTFKFLWLIYTAFAIIFLFSAFFIEVSDKASEMMSMATESKNEAEHWCGIY